ncbi:coiled-coil domain-containing protein [Schlesneria paludicola]|uniref:hypothetical protein n=1 Tax=Schlesneria paludicola TaxID=360056 RepID=UPI00029AD40A|nr:hypothetical protein [Schlesneria paludicola]
MWNRPRDRRHRFPLDHDAGRLAAAFRLVHRLPILICFVLVCGAALGDEPQARYFEQLRQRSLFALAETEAIARLAADDLSLATKTDLTLELSRSLAEHAGFVPEDQRNELWQRARQAVLDLVEQDRSNPRVILLQLQIGSVWAVEADWLRTERDVRTFDETILEQAQAACAETLATLTPLENSLTNPTPESAAKRAADIPLSGHERRTVMHQARWYLAATYRNRAELAAAGSAERSSDLAEADQVLRRLVGVADEPLHSRAKLLSVTCLRLKGENARAAEALGLLERSDAKGIPLIQDEIIAERARLQLALNRPTDAAELILKARATRQRLTGEVWFLQTQALISLRKIALEKQQETLAERLAEQIVTAIERCEEQVGGYWSRRCRQIWENVQTSQKYGAELDSLMQQARIDFTTGRIDAAVERYAKAERVARDRAQPDLAMELGFTRASILLEHSRFEPAAAEFLRLASYDAAHTRSTQAHLLGTYCLGRLYDEKKTQARREAYTNELDQHLAKYAEDTTVNEAYFLKAQLEEQRLQATQALPLYLQVDTQHVRALDAMSGAARCYETILRRMIEQHRPSEMFEREGIDQMSKFLSLAANAPDKWTVKQADVALHLAAFLLMSSHESANKASSSGGERGRSSDLQDLKRSARPEQARQWLSQVLSFAEQSRADDLSTEARHQLVQRANSLNVIALAGTGKRIEAQRALTQLTATPKELLGLVDQLVPFVAAAQGDAQIQLAALQLQAAERVQSQRDQLSPAETALLDRCRAKASFFAGQSAKAVALGQQLAERFASDLDLQRELANLFGESRDVDASVLVKKCWRRIESQSKAGTSEWWTARLGVIQTCIREREYDEARKLLRVTKVLYPELGGPAFKPQMDSIEHALKANSPTKP